MKMLDVYVSSLFIGMSHVFLCRRDMKHMGRVVARSASMRGDPGSLRGVRHPHGTSTMIRDFDIAPSFPFISF